MTAPRYPLRPLLEASHLSYDAARLRVGASGKDWSLSMRRGLLWLKADRWAVRLGLHPFEVWPEMLDDALNATDSRSCVDCGTVFTPAAECPDAHVYCSLRCKNRVAKRRARARERETRAA